MFNKQEFCIYAVVWIIIFLAPVLGLFIFASLQNVQFEWNDVWSIWRALAFFLAVFLIHDLLVAPILVKYNKKLSYVLTAFVLIAVALTFNGYMRPDKPAPPHLHPDTGIIHQHELPKGPPVAMHDIMALAMLLTTIGANISLKLFFKSQDEQRRAYREHTVHLQQELDYLRYQVNPHFLMNTLNNIHALIDIEPARAKQSIVELSRMLRYLLYGTNTKSISLEQGFQFLNHYISLLRLRHDETKVKITLDLPQPVPAVWLPPLLFIPFIENAFKHGISYNRQSFIYVGINVADGMIHFKCRNSIPVTPQSKRQKGGIGVTNVKRRLELLFGQGNYSLFIGPDDNAQEPTFTVTVDIPALTAPLDAEPENLPDEASDFQS